MNPAATSISDSKNARTPKQIRGPEIGPALKRDMLLQRVRAARKRLTPASDGFARVR
jgi:hypothetical protein